MYKLNKMQQRQHLLARRFLLSFFALSTAIGAWANDNIGAITWNDTDGCYEIASEAALKDLAVYVNGVGTYSTGAVETTAHNCERLIFKQTADIDLQGGESNQWTPIGRYSSAPFMGRFNGNGKNISNLYIHTTQNNYIVNVTAYLALFGDLHTGGIIENVNLVNCDIYGYSYVAGIAAEAYIAEAIRDCTVSGKIETYGEHGYAGGIVSSAAWTSFYRNFVTATVKGTKNSCIGSIAACYDYTISANGDNYYIAGENHPGGVGVDFKGYSVDRPGFEAVFTIAAGNEATHVTLPEEPTLVYNNKKYYKNGTVVTLSYDLPDNMIFAGYRINTGVLSDATVINGEHTLKDCADNVTITGTHVDELTNVSEFSIADIADLTYDGIAKEPELTVTVGEKLLVLGTDYNVVYTNNTNAGDATATLTGMGGYTGTTTKTYHILPYDISGEDAVSVSGVNEDYLKTGSVIHPVPTTVKRGDTVLSSTDDYDVSYTDGCVEVGDYIVSVIGKGNYTGTKVILFNIYELLPGAGTEENPFVLSTVADWDHFTRHANYYAEGTYLKLGDTWDNSENPIETATPRDASKCFCGTFDGNGKTLYVNYTVKENYYSPFAYVNGAAIKNLHVAGTISSTRDYTAGIVGWARGNKNTIIQNCRVSATICNNSSWIRVGGLVGRESRCVNFNGCLFDGKLISSKKTTSKQECGGFVGYNETSFVDSCFVDCLYAPASLEKDEYDLSNESRTFVSNKDGIPFVNCYYTRTLGKPQGKAACATATKCVNIGTEGTVYNVSGITAYGNGLKCNGLYYMMPDSVNLCDTAADNSVIIEQKNGYFASVTLRDCTLYKNGEWSTICLPFDVDLTAENCPFSGCIAKALVDVTLTDADAILVFGDAVTKLEAGTPYIIKWDESAALAKNAAIVTPEFTGVVIDKVDRNVSLAGGDVKFIGNYDVFDVDASVNGNIYYMVAGNQLQPADKTITQKAFRAYFQFSDAVTARNVVLNTGDGGELTGIIMNSMNNTDGNGWYTLEGLKLDKQPTQKGVYIHNGRKVVAKCD